MPWTQVGNLTPPINTGTPPNWQYQRPTDWLPLPAVNVGEQKLVGLFAVFPQDGSNFLALNAAGAYTVNWGDGTAPENIATGVQANHLYTYATVSASTDSTRGYRQVIVTVTPQAGQTLTTVNLGCKHTQAGLPTNSAMGWLDIRIAGASVTSMRLAASTAGATVVLATMLEQFEYVGPSAITNLAWFFNKCYNLKSILGPTWAKLATSITSWLAGCNSLPAIIDMDLSKVTSGGSAFANLKSLQRVSGVNLSASTTGNGLFDSCPALQEVSTINLTLATNVGAMFNMCTALTSVTGLITPNATNVVNMFFGCAALRTVAIFDTSKVDSFQQMFYQCTNLQTIPAFNTAKGDNFGYMFNECSSLIAIPAFNMALGTGAAGFVTTCPSLASVGVVGLKVSCDFTGCRLSSAALNALYTQLGTASGQTLTVTGNYGTTADNPSIATAKGWAVTGS